MSVQIIVNADDLGMSEVVNDAIFAAMERNVITSATILGNGPKSAAAAKRVHQFPNCSFGVHLNLTEFTPVGQGSANTLSALLDSNGSLGGRSPREVPLGLPMLRAIYREWCAQIEYVINLGVEPTHLDGHHHIHTIPQMLPLLGALRRRYQINRVRISRNMYDRADPAGKLLLAKKWLYNSALTTMGFKTAHIFTQLEVFLRVCANRPPKAGVVELMTHPGSTLSDEETTLLAGDWTRKLSYKPVLVSYKSL